MKGRKEMELDFSRIIHYQTPLDHTALIDTVEALSSRYPFLGISYLGESILGKKIPILTLGEGKKEILYIGAHHGMEWITSILLLRFVNEFCELYSKGGSLYRTSLSFLWEKYTLSILPMLNPDGVDYQIHGIDKDNPLYERLIKMNDGSCDFSRWQANARGVDLNHNYDAGFSAYKKIEKEAQIEQGAPTKYSGEAPESEPEVAYLCNYIRFHDDIRLILTLHTQGKEIYYQSGEKTLAKSVPIARRIAALSGYRLSNASGTAAYGGLMDWCIQKMNLPCFTLECGKGENPLPLSSYFPIYASLREIFFTVPKMV